MKIISLNMWYGELSDALENYLRKQLIDTDIFCFQEATGSNAEAILARLFSADTFRYVSLEDSYKEHTYSLRTYVRRTIPIKKHQILSSDLADSGKALSATIESSGQPIVIVNVHGYSRPVDKLDTPARRQLSATIINHTEQSDCPAIICGDFNLLPGTASVAMFPMNGYTNLIQSYDIATTRNCHAWDRFPDNIQLFADYAFVSPSIQISTFDVPNIEVSDHLPLEITADLSPLPSATNREFSKISNVV